MYNNQTIAVVVPCFNEEKQISKVIDTMPDFVDRIVIINDGSTDQTEELVKQEIDKGCKGLTLGLKKDSWMKSTFSRADELAKEILQQENTRFPTNTIYKDNESDRIVLINQDNSGVGMSIATGYRWCRDHGVDCTSVMAGDGQMDPCELESIIKPVVCMGVDYVKGNRLIHKSARLVIPKVRFFGNSILSVLTKIASGYWNISDTQTGFTAISLDALESLALHDIYPSYGCPNDILVKLNMSYCSIKEVPIKPIYNVGETSKMQIGKVIPKVSLLLLKSFFKRIILKYFVRDFHPLSLFYLSGILLGIINIPIFIYIFCLIVVLSGSISQGYYIVFLLFSLFSFQSVGLAMWMDIQDNAKLYK